MDRTIKITLNSDYFIEIDPLNYTLKQQYSGRSGRTGCCIRFWEGAHMIKYAIIGLGIGAIGGTANKRRKMVLSQLWDNHKCSLWNFILSLLRRIFRR